MGKIRRINNFQHTFSFTTHTEQFDLFFDRFLESDLGKIYSALPWDELIKTFGLSDAQKGATFDIRSPRETGLDVFKTLCCMFRQAFGRAAQRQYRLSVLLWHPSG